MLKHFNNISTTDLAQFNKLHCKQINYKLVMCTFSARHRSSRKETDSFGLVVLECNPAEKGEQCVIGRLVHGPHFS